MGRDHTIFSVVTGHVQFAHDTARKRSYVHVVDQAEQAADARRQARVFDLVELGAALPPASSSAGAAVGNAHQN